jgi:ubiquinone/menaquinone biosynthesis C-methylase UbiE
VTAPQDSTPQDRTADDRAAALDPDDPDDAQDIEFDLVASWTEDAVRELGPEHAIPAGCRGSGSPADLAWLAEAMAVGPGTRVVDVGSGVGGPAAWLAERYGATPVCVEPMRGAAAAGQRLFGLPTAVADAAALPLATGSADAATCLGVLCTIPAADRPGVAAELRRVLRPEGDLGLLVFVADASRGPMPDGPAGNDFPTEDALVALLDGAGFAVVQRVVSDGLAQAPRAWQERADAVEDVLARRHGDDPRFRRAQQQSARIGRLIGDGYVRPLLVHARVA